MAQQDEIMLHSKKYCKMCRKEFAYMSNVIKNGLLTYVDVVL